MAKAKQEFLIVSQGQPDFRCLPLWVAQNILLKLQADQLKTKAVNSGCNQLTTNDPSPKESACTDSS